MELDKLPWKSQALMIVFDVPQSAVTFYSTPRMADHECCTSVGLLYSLQVAVCIWILLQALLVECVLGFSPSMCSNLQVTGCAPHAMPTTLRAAQTASSAPSPGDTLIHFPALLC